MSLREKLDQIGTGLRAGKDKHYGAGGYTDQELENFLGRPLERGDDRAALERQMSLGRLRGGSESAGGDYGMAQGAQYDALGMYRDQAMGNGPSVAQAQLQSTGDRDMARQMQMQATGRGGNLQATQRAATTAGAAQAQQTRDSLAALRAQEQQQAMAGYAGLGSQMAGQSLQQQAMYEQQLGAANAAQLQGSIQYDLGRREIAAQRARDRTDRNLKWAKFGTKALGSFVGSFFGRGGS